MIKNTLYSATVDFYYTVKGVKNRDSVTVAATQDPNNRPANSWFQSLLENRYPGATIQIISISWI